MNRQSTAVLFVLLVVSACLLASGSASKCNFASRRIGRLCKRNQIRNRIALFDDPAEESSREEAKKSDDVDAFFDSLFGDSYQ